MKSLFLNIFKKDIIFHKANPEVFLIWTILYGGIFYSLLQNIYSHPYIIITTLLIDLLIAFFAVNFTILYLFKVTYGKKQNTWKKLRLFLQKPIVFPLPKIMNAIGVAKLALFTFISIIA